ncbi:AAA family ATPase [Anaerobacillus sp. CMMVII]|uniref:AAA family ATPase n=1 Tax=Anaerobacillus sp. CMMVII TaxID=2755588 RepID=UPI0021B8101E|nr:AAA family ATPase [Anaerobacillus sp. CMMVII]
MKRSMKLLKLTLQNFKGIKNFVLDTNGESVRVFGDNAVGKTTLFDAFIWLLFDKDSHNKKDFQIKTVDEAGSVVNGLDHDVEAEFLLNGNVLTLKKSYKEKWTKKRGSALSEFSGHTTDHFVDSVPVSQKIFKAKVDEIVDEDIFKLLTSPSYFNEQLKKDDRRNVLMKICGDITDQDVISTNQALADLPGILNGRKIEDYRLIIASKRKEINDELDKIPVRISEVNHNLPDISSLNFEDLRNSIANLRKNIDEKELEINRIRHGAEIVEKQKQLREIEGELLDIKNKHSSANHDKVNVQQQAYYKLKSEIESLKYSINNQNQKIEGNQELINRYEQDTSRLRQEWYQINEKSFEFEHDENCPTCGQSLPEDQIEAAHEKARSNFNLKKSEDLERINKSGSSIKEKIEELKQQNERLRLEVTELEQKIDHKQSHLDGLLTEIKGLKENVQDVTSLPEYQEKSQRIELLNADIQQLRMNAQSSIDSIQNQINQYREKVALLDIDLSKFDVHERSLTRNTELKEQERKLAFQFEKLERELHLTEEFIRTKVNLLEGKINSKFKFARFKLFRTQINGGLEEICETTYKGVPYGSGLNNAAKINVGLDIIQTLSEHYNFSAPIFVDNAEAVTKLIDINTQIISLIVSEKDKELRIERNENKFEEAV